jgi:hypothetical protein
MMIGWWFEVKAFCISDSENYWFWSQMTRIKRILLVGDNDWLVV